jgi:hypothetical protein
MHFFVHDASSERIRVVVCFRLLSACFVSENVEMIWMKLVPVSRTRCSWAAVQTNSYFTWAANPVFWFSQNGELYNKPTRGRPRISKFNSTHFTFSYTQFMRKCCGAGRLELQVLIGLHGFSAPEYEKVVFGTPSVCLSVCLRICPLLVPEI